MSKTKKQINSKSESTQRRSRRVSRRSVLKGAAAAAAVAGFTWKSTGPFVRDAKAATLELRWLGWEHYNVKSLTAEFENRHGVKVSADSSTAIPKPGTSSGPAAPRTSTW